MRIIIIGAGEVGFHVARRLAVENKEVVVVDRNSEALQRVLDSVDVQTTLGSGSSPGVLMEAGVEQADILLAVTDSDEINLISCFFANALAPKLTIIARIRNGEYTQYNNLLSGEALHITKIINPDMEVVNAILRMMSVPGAMEINEFADGKVRVIGVRLPEASPLNGVKLFDLRATIGSDISVVIAALVRHDQLIIPGGDDRIEPGDIVYFGCDIKDQDDILERFGIQSDPVRKVLIVGGGNIGLHLARSLDNKYYHTRLLDRDPHRCEYLSETLDRPIVLQGDATDQDLLQQENVGDMDMVVAVTGDEETNILTCLLVKSLGAAKTITRINNFAYMPLIDRVGIDHLVCPRLSAINSLLHFVRRGKIISASSIRGEEAEVLEAIVEEKSRVAGHQVRDLGFPKGALVLCFKRGHEVIVPRGDTMIEPQDRLVILTVRQNIPAVEKALSVKMEFF